MHARRRAKDLATVPMNVFLGHGHCTLLRLFQFTTVVTQQHLCHGVTPLTSCETKTRRSSDMPIRACIKQAVMEGA